MTKQEARNQLIAEDEAHFKRPLTTDELAAIDTDIHRACGGTWIEWGGYRVTRLIVGRLFTSRKEAAEFLSAEAEAGAPFREKIAQLDAITERAFANAKLGTVAPA